MQGPGGTRRERFSPDLPKEIPPLAKITSLAPRESELQTDTTFLILSSRLDHPPKALISPDVAVCDDCLREMVILGIAVSTTRSSTARIAGRASPSFTTFPTIARAPPWRAFPMCAACQAEYDDPANRRFHAQPNACWDCGPQVQLLDDKGARLDVAEPIREAARLLECGAIVAIKGLGGFHLACDATNDAVVDRLRERKRRVEKPFAVMVRSIKDAERLCVVEEAARRSLLSRERPIVLLPRRPEVHVAPGVAPHNRFLGIFLPYTPLHHLLFAAGKCDALVMTSGNLSEEPIAIDNDEAVQRLRGMADAFLVHNRDILRRCDDSVVRQAAGQSQKMRRSRGFVPVPVALESESPPILAVGGELKSTVCIVRGSEAFLSQHVGDLENLESHRFFEEAIEHLQRILEVQPKVIAYDLHPDYFSTKWALGRADVRLIGVQHHHAHIAACMAENHLDGKVIGIALDGTGYGTDGAIWGGEVLACRLP